MSLTMKLVEQLMNYFFHPECNQRELQEWRIPRLEEATTLHYFRSYSPLFCSGMNKL